MKGELTIQNYKSYTKQDQNTWSTLFERQVENLKKNDRVVKEFWEGINKLKLKKGEIPDFQKLNKILKTLSNFEIIAVTGLIDDKLFFELIRNRKFPVTTWIRKPHEIDYIEQPDMFHDLFGHVPFLVFPYYCDFLVKLSERAIPFFNSNNKEMQYAFSRVYWYSIEFGVLDNNDIGKRQIYGSGIISSFSETNRIFESTTKFNTFDSNLLNERFEKDHLQDFYALVERKNGVCNLVHALEKALEAIDEKIKLNLNEANTTTESIN